MTDRTGILLKKIKNDLPGALEIENWRWLVFLKMEHSNTAGVVPMLDSEAFRPTGARLRTTSANWWFEFRVVMEDDEAYVWLSNEPANPAVIAIVQSAQEALNYDEERFV